jgi:L-ascorbate metabolism protein UlaG (beta-lactamase superfamily)
MWLPVVALLLASPPPAVEADLQYLLNSGWIVRTARHVLIFDYVPSIAGARELPPAAAIDPASFGDRRTVVFVSHGHADHFAPAIASWRDRGRDVTYVMGWPQERPAPDVHVMGPRESWSDRGLEVATTGSTDEGVGFLVRVDGLTVLHAGDHAQWVADLAPEFAAEIDWLAERKAGIDVAFFPIATGRDCDPRPSIREGVREAARRLKPRVLVPMHVRCAGDGEVYERFRSAVAGAVAPTVVVAPSAMGQRFRYQSGRLTAVP